MEEEQAAHHLLNILEERGLNVDLDKILLGFENAETSREAAAWVEEYLHEDTLLTKEELDLYQTLRQKGLLHQYESEGEPVRPILDHELACAIESLQSSTAAIEEQCKVLEAQKVALVKLKALDKPNLDIEHARNERRRKEGQEKTRLDVSVDDVVASLKEQLTETRREIETEKSTLRNYLSERFSSDDQILSRLPGLVSKIVTEPEATEDEKSIEQWCKAIISFRTAEIKARVDTVYLTSLAQPSSSEQSATPDEELKERKVALQAEMEELHSEIASIAEMVVEHEIRQPMIETRDRNKRDKAQARTAWLRYILSTVEYMSQRLDIINSGARGSDDFQQALVHVEEAAAKRMPAMPIAAPTPSIKRIASNPLAFTPMVKLKASKALDLPVTLQDALRYAGISLNHESMEALQDSLQQTHQERSSKLNDHFESTATSTHERLAERSSQADGDVEVIMSALYKHTPFAHVNLTSAKVHEQLVLMEHELEHNERDLQEAEGNELSLSDPKVRAFIAKYGR
ncbi:hypothetical protein J1614_008142 [Plenodomus biglobosus]|nr:hypothetical protein J1614_008142 [Plenodomus biglobosus]